MNEDLIEKIAVFIERQCPRKMFPGMKCNEHSCTVHWMAAQIRNRKFEGLEANIVSSISTPIGSEDWTKITKEELDKAENEFIRRHL